MGVWRIVKDLKYPLHDSLIGMTVSEYPYSINYVMKRRMQLDSYLELPEEKRPPRQIWDLPSELDEWFESAFGGKKQAEFELPVDEGDIE